MDTKEKAYIEFNKPHADELFVLARQHRITYMTLNKAAFDLYRPILEAIEKEEGSDEVIKYLHDNVPDTAERTLYILSVMKRNNSN